MRLEKNFEIFEIYRDIYKYLVYDFDWFVNDILYEIVFFFIKWDILMLNFFWVVCFKFVRRSS